MLAKFDTLALMIQVLLTIMCICFQNCGT